MAAEFENLSSDTPPPSVCPKGGGDRSWYVNSDGRRRSYCRVCNTKAARAKRQVRSVQKIKLCSDCGKRLPHANGYCAVTRATYRLKIGAETLEAQWPGYADALKAAGYDQVIVNVGNHPRTASGFPPPSQIFPGLSSTVDGVLIREGHEKNVTLCRALAVLSAAEQWDYLHLYLKDPEDARHWASLPRWKRPIRKGDKVDHHIWSFFRQYFINIASHANGHTVNLRAQGTQLKAMAGALWYVTDPVRLGSVLSSFGDLLQRGEDPGDVTTKPWEGRR
jgi:hypothetical protein